MKKTVSRRRGNEPVQAQLEMEYSRDDDSNNSNNNNNNNNNNITDGRIVNRVLRVRPSLRCEEMSDRKDIFAGFELPLSKNSKVCDLYQCVHQNGHGGYDKEGKGGCYDEETPRICARRFTESSLAELGGMRADVDAEVVRPLRRAMSWSLPIRKRVGTSVGWSDMEYDVFSRKTDNMRSNIDTIDEQAPSIATGRPGTKCESSPLYPCQVELYSTESDRLSTESEKGSMLCCLDLTSPCSRHHHRRNSMAVKFNKPFRKSV